MNLLLIDNNILANSTPPGALLVRKRKPWDFRSSPSFRPSFAEETCFDAGELQFRVMDNLPRLHMYCQEWILKRRQQQFFGAKGAF